MSVEIMPAPESAVDGPGGAGEIPESTRDRVLYFAEQVLRQEKRTDNRNALKRSLIIKKARERFEQAREISEPTFYKFLADAAKDPTSRISTCGRRKGYYLAEAVGQRPSQAKTPEGEANTEHHSSRDPQEPLRQSCPMDNHMSASESRMGMKTQKIVQKLQELGEKYGGASPTGEYIVESRFQFNCKMADGTVRDITVVIREADVSVFCRPNLPQWFDGNSRVEDALEAVERLLQNPNQPSS